MSIKIFFVDGDEVLEWIVREDGRLLDEKGEETHWSVSGRDTEGCPIQLHLFEGSHSEYGDRDEDVKFESESDFFTLDRAVAEARLAHLRAQADRRRRQIELLKEHGLDKETIARKRADLLRANDLLD